MSPRFLHIRHPEIRWECKEALLCECGDINQESPKAAWANVSGPNSAFWVEKARRDLAEEYSILSLTRGEDKLPAFSGLAKQACGDLPSSEYLAGLFRGSLIVDMLWKNLYQEKDMNRRDVKHWRAPSWSWASLDTFVAFPLSGNYHISGEDPDRSDLVKAYMEIVEATCTPSTIDPMGQVSDGFVTLRGPAFDCSIRDGKLTYQDMPIDGKLYLDRPENTVPGAVLIIRAAKFIRAISAPHFSGGKDTEYSLVLERTDESIKRYRRLGVFTQERGMNSSGREYPSAFKGGRIEKVTII